MVQGCSSEVEHLPSIHKSPGYLLGPLSQEGSFETQYIIKVKQTPDPLGHIPELSKSGPQEPVPSFSFKCILWNQPLIYFSVLYSD